MNITDAREFFKKFYTDQGFVLITDKDGVLSFASGETNHTAMTVTKEELESYCEIHEDLKLLKVGPYETSITGPGYREQLIDYAASSRGPFFSLRAVDMQFTSPETGEPLVRIGPPSTAFVNFFRFRKDRAAFLHDRLARSYFGERSSIADVFARFGTIKYLIPDSEKEIPVEQSIKVFETCLFELSYLKSRHFEIRKEWPSVRQKKWNFSQRKIVPGSSFPLKRISYEIPVIRYYQRAVSTDDSYIQFISFYHIMEYYFISVSDKILYTKLSRVLNEPTFRATSKYLDKLILSVDDHKRTNDETDMLRNVLREYTDEKEIIEFIQKYEDSAKSKIYTDKNKCFGQDLDKINLSDGHVASALAKRIKLIRNSLIHSSDRYERKDRYLPGVEADLVLRREMPLLRFLAEKIIIATAKTDE